MLQWFIKLARTIANSLRPRRTAAGTTPRPFRAPRPDRTKGRPPESSLPRVPLWFESPRSGMPLRRRRATTGGRCRHPQVDARIIAGSASAPTKRNPGPLLSVRWFSILSMRLPRTRWRGCVSPWTDQPRVPG